MTDQTLRTEAGRRLLDFWNLHRRQAHGITDDNDAIPDDILAIEAEAAAQARTEALDVVRTAFDEYLWGLSISPGGESCEASVRVFRDRLCAILAGETE